MIFSMNFAGRHPTVGGKGVSADIFFPGMMAYLILILMAPAYNSFAYEGRGIQNLFHRPAALPRCIAREKSDAGLRALVEIALSIAMLAWRVGLPSAHMLVATCAAIIFTIVGQLTVANWSSITFRANGIWPDARPTPVRHGRAGCVASQILMGGISAVILFTGMDWQSLAPC